VDFLTVHARPSVLEAAVSATRGSETRIVGVTVLTSFDDVDVRSHGSAMGAADLVIHRARQVADSGAAGLVASPQEAAAVREALGPALDIITPGVRPKAGLSGDDQQRIAAPDAAIRAGATRLVVGRPISGADDPRAAAEAIARDIAVA
jgi:orotidine-5'-phosphate decarboxylase